MRLLWTPPEQIIVPRRLWRMILGEVAQRGQSRRESGAFLLAESGSRAVRGFALYDDLDPRCLVGSIDFSGSGFSALWGHCEQTGLRVIADLHTHPGSAVAQSRVDRAHPMISLPGHVALIAPEYLSRRVSRTEIGFHVYRGVHGWLSYHGMATRRRIALVGR